MKKGVSAVVATVLIILITVAAVTIIWSAIIPMIKNNLTGSDDCMKAQSEVSIGTTGYTCKNMSGTQTTRNISLQIAHGPSAFVLDSLDVIVYIGGNTYKESISKGLPGSNQEKVFQITSTAGQNYSLADKIEIAPVLKVGATTKNCGVAQSYDLIACS